MNPLFPTLFLSLFGSAPPAECPKVQPVITVSPAFHGFSLDLGSGRSELTSMMSKEPYPGFSTQGLTIMDFGVTYKTTVSLSDLGGGNWCASIEKVVGTFGLQGPAKVMIAREIPPGSCEYRAVADHESQHVSVGERGARRGARDVQAAISNAAYSSFPVRGRSKAEVYGLANAIVEKAANEGSKAAIATANAENEALDTRESYERLQNSCP